MIKEKLGRYFIKDLDAQKWADQNAFFVRQLTDYFNLVKPDIAIGFLPPANTPALLAAAETGMKVIATNHNVPREDYEAANRWDQNPHDRRLRRSVLHHAAALHVLFPEFGAWFDEALQDKIIAIPNYISPEFKSVVPSQNREKLILAVGRLTDVKNFAQLASAWAIIASEFPDWKVMVYGTGPQHKALGAQLKSLGIADTFILAGHRGDLAPEYGRASIFCHPALYEGFGLAPAEALHCGVPVVAFADCAGVNQFLRNGYNGLSVDRAGGETALADTLRKLMSDDNLRSKLAQNGPGSVSQFSIEKYRENWMRLIHRLLEKDSNANA